MKDNLDPAPRQTPRQFCLKPNSIRVQVGNSFKSISILGLGSIKKGGLLQTRVVGIDEIYFLQDT